MDAPLAPGLMNVVEQRSLKWIFVGGKGARTRVGGGVGLGVFSHTHGSGGVGKTTTSCCLAIELAKSRTNVLLLSTDPAHNLSDAFGQKFGKAPMLVNGFTNLAAMEIDPSVDDEPQDPAMGGEQGKMLQGLASAMPGIDEGRAVVCASRVPRFTRPCTAMSFGKVMQLVQSLEYDVVVFDTAPTGHTLRFLQFPQTLGKTFDNLFGGSGPLGGLMSQMLGMMGGDSNLMQGRMAQMQKVIAQVSEQFQNANLTTFVCVCIPEFLPLYETGLQLCRFLSEDDLF